MHQSVPKNQRGYMTTATLLFVPINWSHVLPEMARSLRVHISV